VNLTKLISPAYSLSDSTVTSDTEDLAVKMAVASKTLIKARRTDLVFENVAKLLKARKSKVTMNKEFTPKKKKDVLKERKFLANNNVAERFSSAIVKAKIEHASVGAEL
jgi:translation initiation factor 2B subunit (eIF-2B alpha/beta/delta family)